MQISPFFLQLFVGLHGLRQVPSMPQARFGFSQLVLHLLSRSPASRQPDALSLERQMLPFAQSTSLEQGGRQYPKTQASPAQSAEAWHGVPSAALLPPPTLLALSVSKSRKPPIF